MYLTYENYVSIILTKPWDLVTEIPSPENFPYPYPHLDCDVIL